MLSSHEYFDLFLKEVLMIKGVKRWKNRRKNVLFEKFMEIISYHLKIQFRGGEMNKASKRAYCVRLCKISQFSEKEIKKKNSKRFF